MNQKIDFHPFRKQYNFIFDTKRISMAACGKRAGKTESAAVKAGKFQDKKPDWTPNGIDPYLGVIIAPTTDMLRRLSLKKFLAYYGNAVIKHNESTNEMWWHDHHSTPGGSQIYGLSADKPSRIEGIKANWIWCDEIFQMSEQLFLECRARIADSKGYLFCTGSLGVQYINPKQHWAYKYFKLNPDENTSIHEWSTADNPYFPQDELESLRNNLDPKTFRQMFEIDWDTVPLSAVYADFDEANVTRGYVYNPKLPTYISIDWGFAHPMACLFFQYDKANDIVYLFDEIVMSGLTLEKLWTIIQSKPYKITGWCCDIAGTQEREQSAISNIDWFLENKRISFEYGRYKVQTGISFVRSYIRNGRGQAKFIVDEVRCPKSLDSIKQYKYPVKNGIISNENPEKLMDDPCDAIRYVFENFIRQHKPLVIEIG